jgi:hypothetical protein
LDPNKPQKIELGHLKAIREIYNKYGSGDSAHSIESLFIWKEEMELSLVYDSDIYSIKESSRGDNCWFFPVGSEVSKENFINDLLSKGPVSFNYMTQNDIDFLDRFFPDRFSYKEDPDSSEYIIDRDVMENLPGSSFSKDRGHINRLLKSHTMETVNIKDVTKADIYNIVTDWDASKHQYFSMPDAHATKNIIDHMEDLGLTGIVIFMDGVPYSVCAGFELNEDTVDCVIQKNRGSQQGLTYYLRQEYARSQPPKIRFFNWEEDLGIEGLRRAKQLMRPCSMITMFTGRSNEK